MIKIENVTKRYGTKAVVDKVSINIPEEKITSLIGPNGAGKSTLLAMMSRLLDKEEGHIWIDGQEVNEWDTKELAKQIAILKQNNHMNIRLTIRELVSFGRFPYSNGRLTEEDEIAVDQAIDYMQLKEFEGRFLDQLSGGQRQRAYIAMTIAQDTKYIFLDEPLNSLDMRHAVEIMKILRDLVNNLKKTVVIVIHDINFASCYSDYIVALTDGQLASEGSTHNVIDSKVLGDIYQMDFTIQEINQQKICVYY